MRARVSIFAITALAVLVRLLFLSYSIPEHYDYFFPKRQELLDRFVQRDEPYLHPFGWEASSIACALVCKDRGFSDPFGAQSGPTAWIAPGVVVPFAAAFAVFGCFSFESIFAVFMVSLLCSALICLTVYWVTKGLFGSVDRALMAALLFAVLPYDAWIFRVTGHLDFNFVTLGFAMLLAASVLYYRRPGVPMAAILGAVAGASILVFPGFILCALGAWLVTALSKRTSKQGLDLCVVCFVAGALVAPYVLWQRDRLGVWVPVKSNAGFELYLGNAPEAGGILTERVLAKYHPSQSASEFRKYRDLGEVRYVRSKFREMLANFSTARFLENTMRRMLSFYFLYDTKSWDRPGARLWAKRVLWFVPGCLLLVGAVVGFLRKTPAWWLVVAFSLAYSAPFLIAGVMDRYRYPLAPAICVLAAGLLPQIGKRADGRSGAKS